MTFSSLQDTRSTNKWRLNKVLAHSLHLFLQETWHVLLETWDAYLFLIAQKAIIEILPKLLIWQRKANPIVLNSLIETNAIFRGFAS